MKVEPPSGTNPVAKGAESPRAPATALVDVVRDEHRRNLELVQLLPRRNDHITSTEALVLVRLCSQYHVDWTQATVALAGSNVKALPFDVYQLENEEPRRRRVMVTTFLAEDLLGNGIYADVGVYVPSFDPAKTSILLGQLRNAILERAEVLIDDLR